MEVAIAGASLGIELVNIGKTIGDRSVDEKEVVNTLGNNQK